MKRYFIVFYTASRFDKNGFDCGSVDFITQDGGYLNSSECLRKLKELHKHCSAHIITNIIELCCEDYKQWSA